MHGVSSDCFALISQIIKHFLKYWYLISLLMNSFLRQNYTVFCHIGAENLQSAVRMSGLCCVANGLPVHGDYLSRSPKPRTQNFQNDVAYLLAVNNT